MLSSPFWKQSCCFCSSVTVRTTAKAKRRGGCGGDEGSYEGKGEGDDYDVAAATAAVEPFVRVFPDLLILGVLDHGGFLSFAVKAASYV